MRYVIAPVKNITKLGQAGDALARRSTGVPGMGLLEGPTGYGKTTAAAWFRNRVDGVYVRAMAVWTPTAMLGAIVQKLGGEPGNNCSRMMSFIIEKLQEKPRTLMLDEADYIVEHKKMVETLRDIHDFTTVPVLLIGMEGLEAKIQSRKQLTRRLGQKVKFEPADLEDVTILHRALCEVTIEPALLEKLHTAARGSIGLTVVAMERIEGMAKARGLRDVTVADWGNQDFFYGEAPRAAKGGRAA